MQENLQEELNSPPPPPEIYDFEKRKTKAKVKKKEVVGLDPTAIETGQKDMVKAETYLTNKDGEVFREILDKETGKISKKDDIIIRFLKK